LYSEKNPLTFMRDIDEGKWLDVGEIYSEAGWDMRHLKYSWDEEEENTFVFTKKTKK
jgi:hypothetical protein